MIPVDLLLRSVCRGQERGIRFLISISVEVEVQRCPNLSFQTSPHFKSDCIGPKKGETFGFWLPFFVEVKSPKVSEAGPGLTAHVGLGCKVPELRAFNRVRFPVNKDPGSREFPGNSREFWLFKFPVSREMKKSGKMETLIRASFTQRQCFSLFCFSDFPFPGKWKSPGKWKLYSASVFNNSAQL